MDCTITICHSDSIFVSKFKKRLSKVMASLQGNITFYMFDSGDELLQRLKEIPMDLVFLEAGLTNKNGIDVGTCIRNKLENDRVQIVYILAEKRHMMRLFDTHPLNVLLRPVSYTRIEQVIKVFFRMKGLQVHYFMYQLHGKNMEIACDNILFFSSCARKVTIHSCYEQIEFYGVLDEIAENLKKYGFLRVHKSYLINYRYISRFEYKQIVLTDQTTVPISQSRRARIHQDYVRLIG